MLLPSFIYVPQWCLLAMAVSRLWSDPALTHINKPHHGMNIIMKHITIGSNDKQQLTWEKAIGIPLIHPPLLTTMPAK
jgi:hypothetical protein